MLPIQYVREQKVEIIARLSKRGIPAEQMIEALLEKDDFRKKTQHTLDETQATLNQTSKQIGELLKQGLKNEAESTRKKTFSLKEEIKQQEEELKDIEQSLQQMLYAIPNAPYHLVPEGKTAEDNLEIRQGGTIPTLDEGAMPHWELAQKYNLIDFELGVKITGAGFPVYKGKMARLQRAMINFLLDENTQAGYVEYVPPLMVNEASGYGTGQLPDKEGQMYYMPADDLYLIPTSEVPLTNFFRDEILKAESLPVKLTAFTPCFRREAGSYGKEVRGLNRLHQFDKVEIVQVVHPDSSYDVLETMVLHVESILQKLNLPYRILRLCGGDMGFASAMTYDFEVYSAAQKRWLEVSSVSNFESFQANRMKLRFKQGNEKPQLAHTLNGSSLAFPRILAALMENNQTPVGIILPKVLQAYTGFDQLD
ncbi:MAG: serine--tRNA ligase [Flavobacteriales bacterium]|nr:serine--tRNA ligase [Flavobacteriales bacterium]